MRGRSLVTIGRDPMSEPNRFEFEAFVTEVEPDLRRALFAVLGVDRGREATAEALAWAWENWDRVRQTDNPRGYLFRVGQTRTRSRKSRPVFVRHDWHEPHVEPYLGEALSELSESQRVAVVLVHGFGWTMREVGELTGAKVTTIQTHLERGLKRLRVALEVYDRD
jgi:DNA-directed RNA polymerase specialized sigma24 family protein